MPESKNEPLENAENTGRPEDAGDAALRYEAGFYGLKKLVKKSGVTAVEAATRVLQASSTLVTSYSVDDLAKTLSTAEELNAYKPVYHPIGIWLTRAREKGIEYRHSLDWAVKQYGSRTQKLPATSGTPVKDNVTTPVADEMTASGHSASEKGEAAVTMAAQSALPAGVTSAEIIEKFKLGNGWAEKLRKIDRNPFLKKSGALMQRGYRKSGNSPGAKMLWNPVKFAEMLISREGKNAVAMQRIIENRFSDWQDAWDDAQAVDEPDGW